MATKERAHGGHSEGDWKVVVLGGPIVCFGIVDDKISEVTQVRVFDHASSAAIESTRRGPSLMSWRWLPVFLTRCFIVSRSMSGERYSMGSPSVVRS